MHRKANFKPYKALSVALTLLTVVLKLFLIRSTAHKFHRGRKVRGGRFLLAPLPSLTSVVTKHTPSLAASPPPPLPSPSISRAHTHLISGRDVDLARFMAALSPVAPSPVLPVHRSRCALHRLTRSLSVPDPLP